MNRSVLILIIITVRMQLIVMVMMMAAQAMAEVWRAAFTQHGNLHVCLYR